PCLDRSAGCPTGDLVEPPATYRGVDPVGGFNGAVQRAMSYSITLRSRTDAGITGWYDASTSRWSTDHRRQKLFGDKHEAKLIRVPISLRDAQRPYCLIRPDHIWSEPRHLRRFICVRHIAVPASRSPKLSGAPGVPSGLQDIFLLDGGIPRP